MLVITPDPLTAAKLEREIKVFAQALALNVLAFPDWETLPYDHFSPHQDIISDRLLVLNQLPQLTQGLVIVPVTTLMHRIAPTDYVRTHSLVVKVGDELDLTLMRQQLVANGYRYVSEVRTHGEFAIRGAILDLFPMGQAQPLRIELFADEIESLRFFNPDTQLSQAKVTQLELLPAREYPLTDAAVKQFRQAWRRQFEGLPSECPLYQDISQKMAPPGIEYYLPLFFATPQVLLDYLPPNSTIVRWHNIEAASQQFWQNIQQRYEQYGHDRCRPLLPPNQVFTPVPELFQSLKNFSQIVLHETQCTEAIVNKNFALKPFPTLTLSADTEQPLAALITFMESVAPAKILLCAETPGRREALIELFQRQSLTLHICEHWQHFLDSPHRLNLMVAPIDEGAWLQSPAMVIIAEAQLYGQQVMQRRHRKKNESQELSIRSLAELTPGSAVVHLQHGVGRYQGLIHLTVGERPAEFLTLEYAAGDKLYVPVSALHLISQYRGASNEHAPLNRLGSEQWDKAKAQAHEKVADVAAELLDVYAQREAQPGFAFAPPDEDYQLFANQFAFEETPDQAKAIAAVLHDLTQARPMDRLVCGDVGFGKTEVALRAIFLAIQNNKQVAVLVPTTLLAQQHFTTFNDRFADWPVKIEVLSRFKNKKEQLQILEACQQGQIDIVIGTHKLIQEQLKFKALGLVVIDEEHRFGVKQKERLKALRSEVDILTLTATPIPRTLNMAMASIRDLSIIATPPAKRRAIKTFVSEANNTLIEESILRELMRGGQVYYLHNDVQTIEPTAAKLSELIPNARVGIAHGQMPERELERVMSSFYHQQFNVLVCTTIIETGIDIPSANTIIIARADKLGLAQLHQLRGRVGRSHHQAYAYCLTPPRKQLNADAQKRLAAIEALDELGSGFNLATHDLEIRGAGEFLGDEQSGNLQAIGFSLYMELLQRAIEALKSNQALPSLESLNQGSEIELNLPALIPEDYLPDVQARLVLYKRIANVKLSTEFGALQREMIDRFGALPAVTKNLFRLTALRLLAQRLGIKKIELNSKQGKIEFGEQPMLNPEAVIKLIRSQPKHYKLNGASQLKFYFEMPDSDMRFKIIEQLLETIAKPEALH
jgi:transcription-repair coupling factor (superfamily II helicase)